MGIQVPPALEARIAAELKAEIDEATDYCEREPDPDPATAMKWVYAEDWPSEEPPPWIVLFAARSA